MKGLYEKPEMIIATVEKRKTVTRRVIKPQPDMGLPEFERYSRLNVGKYHPTKIDKNGEEYPGDEVFGAYTDDGEWGWTPRYQQGETVYLKEAWYVEKRFDHLKPRDIPLLSIVGYPSRDIEPDWAGKLRSSIFLRQEFARTFITITDVRAERLQEITEQDAIKEGFQNEKQVTWWQGYREIPIGGLGMEFLHQQTMGDKPPDWMIEPHKMLDRPDLRQMWSAINNFRHLWDSLNAKYPWESNPWVFRYEFEYISRDGIKEGHEYISKSMEITPRKIRPKDRLGQRGNQEAYASMFIRCRRGGLNE